MHSASDWPGVDTESEAADVPRDRNPGRGGSRRLYPAKPGGPPSASFPPAAP